MPCGPGRGDGQGAPPRGAGDGEIRRAVAGRSRRSSRCRGKRCGSRLRRRLRVVVGAFAGRLLEFRGGAETPALAKRPQGLSTLLAAGAIEDQYSVEVIDLVLKHPRLEAGSLERDHSPC